MDEYASDMPDVVGVSDTNRMPYEPVISLRATRFEHVYQHIQSNEVNIDSIRTLDRQEGDYVYWERLPGNWYSI